MALQSAADSGPTTPPPRRRFLTIPAGVSKVRIAFAFALAAAIFLFDTISPAGIAVAVLYAVVIMMSVDFCDRRGIILVSFGCAALTMIAFLIGHGLNFDGDPMLRCMVSLSAIAITSLLALRSQRATAILRESERRYRNIFQTAGVSIFEEDYSAVRSALRTLKQRGITDIRGYLADHPSFVQNCVAMVQILDVNEAAVRLFGARDKAQAISSLRHYFLPETTDSFREQLCAMFDGAHSFEYETAIQTADGDRRAILMAAIFPPESDSYRNVLISVLDITERERAQRALEQAQSALAHVSRISTLGELTASIAHEVNQPLAAIVTNGEASLRWLNREPPELGEVRACIEHSIAEGRRAGAVVQRLRDLARRADPQIVALDVNEVIEEVALLVEREATEHGVALRLELGSSLPLLHIDRIQLQQMLINLTINAMHAMETVIDRPRQVMVESQADAPGSIRISVRDYGAGIAADAMPRLFDAFFTTRQEGIGLGLSICRSIVESHGGRIWAENNADHGATFHILLAVAKDKE
ncbi:sensor histidine kinase [Hypericibacter sp.]|uniref:sensor histidine kinase n=1 Tax=Hypericibacter sp. TaxID=2705401 RepID=UPI003D6CE33C